MKNSIFALQIIGIILAFYGIIFLYATHPEFLIPTLLVAIWLALPGSIQSFILD